MHTHTHADTHTHTHTHTQRERDTSRHTHTHACASANRWYDELRKQKDATTSLGSSLPLHALHSILFIVLLFVPAILENCNDHDDK